MSRARHRTPTFDWTDFILRLEDIERDAHDGGLHETAHAINAAVQKAGWERAAQVARRAPSEETSE